MPSWKKLIVSGSDATLNSLQVTTNVTAAGFSGSFSGSFQGDGSGLTNLTVEIAEVASFPQTFTNTSSVLVNHDLDTSYPLVQVYSGDDEQLIPLRIKIINSSSVQVDFSSNESGYVIVAKGGHIISGTAGNAALLNGQPGSYYLDYNNFTNIPAGLVSGSDQLTGSYDLRYVLSGSITQTTWDNIANKPPGIVSSSAQIATEISGAFTSVSQSIAADIANLVLDSGSFSIRITDLENFSASLDNNFVSETEFASASGSFLITGSVSTDTITLTKGDGSTFNLIVDNVNSASFATTASYVDWTNIDNVPTGLVSGSDQLTGSYDQRYVLSGSITQTTWDNIANKPVGIVSSSTQIQLDQISGTTFSASNFTFPQDLTVQGKLTAQEFHTELISSSIIYESGSTKFGDSLDDVHSFTGSLQILGSITGSLKATNGILSSSAQIASEISGAFTSVSQSIASAIAGLITDSGSFSTRISDLESFSASLDSIYLTEAEFALASGSFVVTGSVSDDTITLTKGDGTTFNLIVDNVNSASFAFTASYVDWVDIDNVPVGILSSSAQIASDISGSFTSVSQSIASDIAGLVQDSGSFSTRISDLENFSASLDNSFVSEIEFALATGSFLTTASISDDTITVTKGDGTTFNLIVDNINSASFATTASYVDWTNIDNIPVGILSSSAQIASEISGAFTAVSQSIALDIAGLVQDSGSFSTRITDLENFSSSADSIFVSEVEFALASGSFLVTASVLNDTVTLVKGDGSSFNLIVDNVNSASYATFAETAPLNQLIGTTFSASNFTFPQDLTVQGKITAQEFYTELISSSIIYESGSTKFGDTFDDTHEFTGSVSVTGSLSVNDYTLPVTDGIYPNSVVITNAAGVLEFDIPKTIYEEVKNVSGGPLVKGTPVYVVSTTGNTNNVAPADALDPAKMPASFILEQALNDDEEGLGIILGFINNIDTSGLTAGQIIYVAPGGGYTQTRPTGSALVQALGIPVRIDPTNGSGIIFNPGTSLDLPNIEPGYFWFGDTNSVPTSASVASLRTGSYTGSFIGDGSGLIFPGTGILSSSAQIASEISGAFTAVSQSIASDIAGLITDSGSFSTRITDLESFSSSLDASFISETEFALASGSFLTTASISDDTITLTKGDGTTFNLIVNNVDSASFATTASYVDWTNIDNVPVGIISSSAQLNNSTLTGMIVSGSFSGSFQGDGSGLTGITATIESQTALAQTFTNTGSVTVNHLLNTAYPLVQVYTDIDEQIIPQRIKILNSSSVQVDFSTLESGYVVVAKGGHIISGTAGNALLLEGEPGSYYLDYNNFTNVPAVDPFPYTGSAIISGSLIVTGSINATSFTGDGSGLTGVGAFPFTGSAGISGSLTINGTLTATTIVETSSERFKENINDLPPSLDHILSLRPVTFNRIGSDRPEVGFIAEQAQNSYPEVIVYDEHGRTSGIEYSRLTAPLVKAIQDLAEIIRTQDQKIQDLARKLDQRD